MRTLIRPGPELKAREDLALDHKDGLNDDVDIGGGLGTKSELLDRPESKLDHLRANICNAWKGISKLESQVSYPAYKTKSASVIKSMKDKPCLTCGCLTVRSSSGTLYLSIRIPRIYHTARKTEQSSLSPTPFGYFLVVFWTWHMFEWQT